MAATASASSKAAAVTAALVLALVLACAAAQTKHGHDQCNKYARKDLEKVQRLLESMKHVPLGASTVRCSDKEKSCLMKSMVRMPDGLCQKLGQSCTLKDGRPGMVRANLDEWRARRRLVGKCAPQPRRNDTYVLVRQRWFSSEAQYVQAGHLFCACALLAPPPVPLRPFPDHNCVCDGRPNLQPAPFGGYECVRKCRRTCSPQPDTDGSCIFPPLAADNFAVVYVTTQFALPESKTVDAKGHELKAPPKKNGSGGKEWDTAGSQLFHRYLPRFFYETP